MKPISPDSVSRILVRATNWVGDAVISIPAIREIRNVFPSAHIAIAATPWVRDVYAWSDFADEVIEFDRSGVHRGVRGLIEFARLLRSRRFDLAILLQNAFEAALVAQLARIPRRLGYRTDGRGFLLTHSCRIDPELRRHHQCYYYLGMLAEAGWIRPAPWQRPEYRERATLRVRETELAAARSMLESLGVGPSDKLIGINPGAAYGGAKRWIADRFAAVADGLASDCGARVLIFGAATDAEAAREVAAAMRSVPILLAGRTTLAQLMALLKLCRVFVTNDSGPMHLAAALDVPQVAIFGSTDPTATGPLSASARILQRQVDCSPCFLRECPVDFRCMRGITVADVREAALGLWSRV